MTGQSSARGLCVVLKRAPHHDILIPHRHLLALFRPPPDPRRNALPPADCVACVPVANSSPSAYRVTRTARGELERAA